MIQNHALPDGNKRVGYLCLREFVARNGRDWSSAGVDETVAVIEAVAAGTIREEELAGWIAARLG